MQKSISAQSNVAECRTNQYKKAQLSLTNPRDAKPCQKVLQFDVETSYRQLNKELV